MLAGAIGESLKIRELMMDRRALILGVMVSAGIAWSACSTSDNRSVSAYADGMKGDDPGPKYLDIGDDHQMRRPRDYRKWVFVGAPVTPHDMNKGKAAFPEFHNVYIDPASYDAWLATGKFPDNTVILKELVSVAGKKAESGNGYFMGDYIGLEALVKSSRHFPDEPDNWAFFSFTAEKGKPPVTKAKALPTSNCAACHQAGADDELVFTQYYPVLRAAKAKKSPPENL